jgi:hypothetical protein
MTVVEIYLAEADKWNECSKETSDPDLYATYTMLAVAYRKLGASLGEMWSLSANDIEDGV